MEYGKNKIMREKDKGKMKVLLVNPWGIKNDGYYLSGFIAGMNEFAELDFVSNYYYSGTKPNGILWMEFFKRSERMIESKKRTLLRGAEYIKSWIKVKQIIKEGKYDIIHFHWLLYYPVDLYFIKQIKRHISNIKLVLTAHNVYPHINGNKQIHMLKKIYNCFDIILVHGEGIKKEFVNLFPELGNKIRIQMHGIYYGQSYIINDNLDNILIKKFNKKRWKYRLAYISFGYQYYNKGTDRLIDLWRENFLEEDAVLIIVGKKDSAYPELDMAQSKILERDNILFIGEFIEDSVLNYMIKNSDIVIIPYRHATMSGVFFTAADFKKTVICTNTGAIAEYIENGDDGFVCGTDDIDLFNTIQMTLWLDREILFSMGTKFYNNIHRKFSWSKICKELVENVYESIC